VRTRCVSPLCQSPCSLPLCLLRLWRRYDPAVYATIWGYDRAPNKIWELIRDFLEETQPAPNQGHLALASLEADGVVTCVVTQNVDNLHQESGSKRVVEYHGSLLQSECRNCRAQGGLVVTHLAQKKTLPPRCMQCGGPLKPSAVLFGERIPPTAAREAEAAVSQCDVLLVIGTSATVRPAADLPRIAARRGATVIEVNTECSALTDRVSDLVLLGKSGETLPKVLDAVRRRRMHGGRSASSRPTAEAVRPGHSMLGALR
jgi:NAD-dependent deacetylase